jgi:LPXTG-motif cell wall-anchored protein
MLNGETAEPEAPAETEAPATEAPTVATEPVVAPADPAVNTESSNPTALILGVVAVIAVAAGAFFVLKKKK